MWGTLGFIILYFCTKARLRPVTIGDITISLADVELLKIKIRLLIASVDKAKEMRINWWETDPYLSTKAKELQEENVRLRQELDKIR